MTPSPIFPRAPRLWPGATIVCIATGPSLLAIDVASVVLSGHPIIVVNDAYKVCPGADVLYATDVPWWQWHVAIHDAELPAWKFGIDPIAKEYRPDLITLQRTGAEGIDFNPHGLCSGGHSGYQAINLAVHLGAATIVLLGYDLQPAAANPRQHHSTLVGEHPDGSHPRYVERIQVYATLVQPLADHRIRIVNASRSTAITAVPCLALEEALRL